jgi:lysyl-tRNA synthetase class 2
MKATGDGARSTSQAGASPGRVPYLLGGHTRGVNTSVQQGWRARDRIRRLASYSVALIGLLGLLSAISRPARGRLETLLQVLPFVVPRSAATTLVFVSFTLMLTARGLRHGQRLAWTSTLLLLATSAVLHLLKGLDAEESVAVMVVLVGLATQHAAFPVLPSRAALARTMVLGAGGALVAIVMATALAQFVGRHHYPHLGESTRAVAERLGGQESLPLPGVGGFVTPMLFATGLGVLVSTLWLLLSPRLPLALTESEHMAERERARRVVQEHGGDTLAYFALRDDKQWFFSGRSVVAHAVRNGVCLVSPDPIGPLAEREEVWAEFMTYVQRNGWSVSVIGALPEWLPVYEASGLRSVYVGDEAIVDCQVFSLEAHAMKSLRGARNRVQRAGYTASFHDPAALDPELEAALKAMSANSRRGEVERGFSMTLSRLFDPADTGLMLTVARCSDGRVGGFIQWIPAADIDGWSLDVMRRSTDEDIPNGIIDFLILETIHHVATLGGHGLALNFAVMRAVVSGEQNGVARRVGRTLLHKVSDHAQIESLWKFNAKYDPKWRPRYVVLDSVEFMLTQGLVMAGAEGVNRIPVIGRYLGSSSR